MKRSQEVYGALIEAFADLPHILVPEERRPYFDKAEAELVASKLTEKDSVPRTVNFRSLEEKEVRNRFPKDFLPDSPDRNPFSQHGRPASIMIGPDGESRDWNVFTVREYYWIDREE